MKKLHYFILVAICLFCTACGSIPADTGSIDFNSEVNTNWAAPQSERIQDIRQSSHIAPPDELVYLKDGAETVFVKGTSAYDTILQMNTARYTEPLSATQGLLDESYHTRGDYLIYRYTSSDKLPVLYHLVEGDADENTVIQYESGLSKPEAETDELYLDQFGSLAPADDLLAYLETVAG